MMLGRWGQRHPLQIHQLLIIVDLPVQNGDFSIVVCMFTKTLKKTQSL
jgi:hypothetical protein